jgi:plasmid maintenance system antidote protein VapI
MREFGALDDVPGLAPDRFDALKREEVQLSHDDAARLAEALGTTVEFWLNLQARFDARSP